MPKLMTQRDVAKALGISADRVREYTRAGLIEHVTLPGFRKPKYTVEGVEKFIEERTQHAEAQKVTA